MTKAKQPKSAHALDEMRRAEQLAKRICPDCDGKAQGPHDVLKFRPRRKVWICPACLEFEDDWVASQKPKPKRRATGKTRPNRPEGVR